jgi:hypothetical protein
LFMALSTTCPHCVAFVLFLQLLIVFVFLDSWPLREHYFRTYVGTLHGDEDKTRKLRASLNQPRWPWALPTC